MVLWWGNPGFTQFYNDAYISFLGEEKHPIYLGRSGRDCWSEIWPTIGPMLESVYSSGETTWSEDLLLILQRKLPRDILVTVFKKPFSVKGFGNMVSDAIRDAGPSSLQAAWATEGRCATSSRGGLLSKRDHGDHRTQELSPRWSATRALLDRNSWRGEQSNDSQKTKVANLIRRKWQTLTGLLKLLA